jgi:hypothetical protein
MIDLTPYEHLSAAELYPALLAQAREQAVQKGQGFLTDVEVMERLVRAHPEGHEYLRLRTMGLPVPRELTTPGQKADTSRWQAYAPLDFPQTQTTLLDAARAEAVQKGLPARADDAVLQAYFRAHDDAYQIYTHKHRYGTGLPSHLRGQAGDVRTSADELELFRKVVDDPELRDLARVRARSGGIPSGRGGTRAARGAQIRRAQKLQRCLRARCAVVLPHGFVSAVAGEAGGVEAWTRASLGSLDVWWGNNAIVPSR